MAALCDESVKKHQFADPADDTGQNSWNASQTRMLISHFKENAILWDKSLKHNGNKAKTKVIVTKSSPKNLSADCRSTVGRQLTDRLPTVYRQLTNRLEATCRRRLRRYLPVMANLRREGKLLPLKFDERFYAE